MKGAVSSFLALAFGLVFGAGLILSGMIDTANVKGFLDITGVWKPALLFVMGGAVLVALPLFQWTIHKGKTLNDEALEVPPQKLDARLLIGAAIFGVGWGLSGICPGPSIVWLGIDPLSVLPFIFAVVVGAFLADQFRSKI